MAQHSLEVSEKISRNSKAFLETLLPRYAGEKRDDWFKRLAAGLQIAPRRLKSLYYDPRCKMWAEELEQIQQRQGVIIRQQIKELRAREAALSSRLNIIGEAHETHSETRRSRGAAPARAPAGAYGQTGYVAG